MTTLWKGDAGFGDIRKKLSHGKELKHGRQPKNGKEH
jgi:hypothetical protein